MTNVTHALWDPAKHLTRVMDLEKREVGGGETARVNKR